MRNDHRAHNQRRAYDRASQGDRADQGGVRQSSRGPRKGDGPRGERGFGGSRGPRDNRDPRKGPAGRDGGKAPFDKKRPPHGDRGPVGEHDRSGERPFRDDRDPRGPRRDGNERDGRPSRDDRGSRNGDGRGPEVRRQRAHRATSARELALAAVHQMRERDAFAQDIIAKTIDTSKLSREDRAFATRLVLGVVSTRGTLEDILDGCMDSPDDAAPAVRDALCVSTYEIIFLQKSAHAAVDQGVELVKSVAPRAGGLANAVLRRVVRAREAFPFGDVRTDLAAYARLHGFPVWLAERLIAELGPRGAHDFMVASNEPAPVFISVNAAKADEAEVVEVLAAAHGEPVPVEVAGRAVPGCYRLASGTVLLDGRVRRMLNQGLLLVSDATSQAVASLVVGEAAPASFLEIGAGRATKTILDQSCAARRFGGQVPDYVTVDNHAFKTRLLRKRVEQFGVEVAEALTGDGTALDEVVGERTFDTVFIDAPCTGLGTLRRHPEIRWRLTPEAIGEAAELGSRLIASAAAHVAQGGVLAYATCTITHEENIDVVEQFLASEAGADFELVPYTRPDLGDVEAPFFSVALEPGGSDAHFLALLRRKA